MTEETEKEPQPKYVLADRETVMRLTKECLEKHADIIERLAKR